MSRMLAVRDHRPATERLMEAAEILIGQHGVDGVSLRQIGSAAGSSNDYAVQYHFGDAGGLIHAILVKHISEGEVSQRIMLQRLQDEGRLAETRSLLDILLRPILDPLNGVGECSYARFIVVLLNSQRVSRISTNYWIWRRSPAAWSNSSRRPIPRCRG